MTKTRSLPDDIPPEINPEDIVPSAPEQQPAPPDQEHPQAPQTGYTGSPWQEGWRSALDDPNHPQHNLRDA